MSQNSHILITPIYNLKLTAETKKELYVEKVYLIDKEKLLRNLKRGGFPWTFAQLKRILAGKPQAKLKIQQIREFFDGFKEPKANTFAIIRIAGFERKYVIYGWKKIQEAIWILASSQLGCTKRGKVIRFGAPEHGAHIWNRNLVVPTTIQQSLYKGSMQLISPVHEYLLGERWGQVRKHHFIPTFLKIINDRRRNIDAKWKKCLKQAVTLAGKSLFSKEISLAFLYNMIAIETLLKKRGEAYLEVMPNRVNDLFGWLYRDDQISFKSISKIIKDLYKLRNDFVHNADENKITAHDLIETDVILNNLLYNFCRLKHVFKSKEEIIKLSKEFEARRVLNLKLKRPKKIRFSRMQYYLKDYERIEEKGI